MIYGLRAEGRANCKIDPIGIVGGSLNLRIEFIADTQADVKCSSLEKLSPFIADRDKIHTFGTSLRGEGALKDPSK